MPRVVIPRTIRKITLASVDRTAYKTTVKTLLESRKMCIFMGDRHGYPFRTQIFEKYQ